MDKIRGRPYKKKLSFPDMAETKKILRKFSLHSVCEEAKCPNISECFAKKTATFLILGDTCTRNCSFCGVKKGKPGKPDKNEPANIAGALKALGIRYAVITSVTRDDLPDGGAGAFAETVRLVKDSLSLRQIEILVPDFRGSADSIKTVVEAGPDIIAHNVETVPSLYPLVRNMADYKRSLGILAAIKKLDGRQAVKSGIMLGLGEKKTEVLDTMEDIAATGCDFLSIGQYLAPGRSHYKVARYIPPEEFDFYALEGKKMGFKHIESGCYVRSSYNAHRYKM